MKPINFINRTIFLFLFIISISLDAIGQAAPPIKWENTYNANFNDIALVVIPTTDGGYLYGGYSNSDAGYDKSQSNYSETYSYNHRHCSSSWWGGTSCSNHTHYGTSEYYDYWIIKTDADGNKLWDRTIGGLGNDYLRDVVQTLDGGYILLGSSATKASGWKSQNSKGGNDFWIVKINANGDKVWDRTLGGSNSDEALKIISSPGGGYLLAGYSYSVISGDKSENNKGGYDYWIVKINENGNKEWDKTFGGTGNDFISSIVADDNGYYLGGYSDSNTSGDKSENSKGAQDYWALRLDLLGNKIWEKTIGGTSSDILRDITLNEHGGPVLAGYSQSPSGFDKSENSTGNDYWVVSLDENGSVLWENTLIGSGNDVPNSIINGDNGKYLVSGYSDSNSGLDKAENSRGSYDYWVIEIDNNGDKIWDKTIGGSNSDILYSAARNNNSDFMLFGYSVSPASGDKSENSLNYDYWAVVLVGDTPSDNTPPVITANPITVATDDGVCAAVISAYYITTSDNSGGSVTLSYSEGHDLPATFPIGTTTVTVIAADEAGNSSETTFEVTVNDETAPAVLTQDISVDLDETGVASITTDQIDNGSSDACGIASIALDKAEFSCAEVGENTVTLTVTDENGNSASATAVVTVNDVTAPTVVTLDISVDLDETGAGSITASQIDNGSSDACGIASIVLDDTTFGCSDVGTNTVTLTVTDVNGNMASATAVVTVNEVTAPTVITQDISVDLDETGAASITTDQIDNGSSDACGIASIALDNTEFSCAEVGENTVTLTVTDVNGNMASATAVVTVNDLTAPAVVTQDISIDLDETGAASITASQIDNGSSDACGIAGMVLDNTVFGCGDVGTNTVTLTVTDVNGNMASATAIVTVNDVTAPTVVTQDISIDLDETGAASITASQIDNGSSDACGIASIGLDNTAFSCAEVGENTVTLTVTDVNGNMASATAVVTINDVTAPTVVTQDISIDLDETGTATITTSQIDNGSSDACGIAGMVLDNTVFGCGDVGTNTVTLTVTDVNGNMASATAVVTVNDVTAPTVVTQNISIDLDASGAASVTASQIDNGSSDACGIAGMVLDNTVFGCGDVGTNTVTLTVTDVNGNMASATAVVTVNDVTAPTIVTQNISIDLDASGAASVTASQIDNGSSDACGIAGMVLDNTVFGCGDVGTNTVTLTVTDVNGNMASATAVVTVNDVTAPTIVTQNISIDLDASGAASVTASQIDNVSSDACGIAGMVLDNTVFGCGDVGTNTVTLTVTDVNGNMASATAVVTVNDVTAPTVVTQNISIDLDASGAASVTASQIDNGSSDACGIAGMVLDNTVFGCGDVGTNTVTLTVTDVNGNMASATAVVTVNDVTAPTVVTQNISIDLDASGAASVTASQIDNGSSDACGIAGMVLDNTVFGCGDVGTNTVTLTVTDVNGNMASATAVVTVNDVTAPTVVTQNISIDLDASGAASVTASQIDNGSSDACGIAGMVLDNTVFGCGDVGTNTVTLTVTDVNGNMASATAVVTVNDVTAPTVVTQDISIDLDETGTATLTTSQIDNGSSDACGIASIALDNTAFSCAEVGENTVSLTVTDVNGNSASMTAIVTVIDNIDPVIVQPEAISVLNDPDLCGAVIELSAPVVSDNCEVISLVEDAPDVFPVGNTTVTWTATDPSGNSSSVEQTIEVYNEAPVISTVSINVEPIHIGNWLDVSADFVDNNLSAVEWYWGDGSSTAGWIEDEKVFGEHLYSAPGLYQVSLKITDLCDESETYIHNEYVVIYDPNAGFVTGGGWINSPAGAIMDDPTVSGKANFGFVARYKKNSSQPNGSINFKIGDINLKGKDFDYLVLRNQMAIAKGSASLGGYGEVSFILSVVDGGILGFDTDYFRIKIWDEVTGKVFYDNESIQPINTESSFELGNGSIVIHLDKAYENTEAEYYHVFPNPYTDVVQLNVTVPQNEVIYIYGYDKLGNLKYNTERDLVAGENGLRLDLLYIPMDKEEMLILKCSTTSLGSFYVKLLKE